MNKLFAKLGSFFMVLAFMLVAAPGGIFAADTWTLHLSAPDDYSVTLYESGSDKAIGTYEGDNNEVKLAASAETYTYTTKDGDMATSGSGQFKVTADNSAVTLCTVNFSAALDSAAPSYRMTLVNHEDNTLKYKASPSNPGFFVLPRLGGDGYYDYQMIGLDANGKDDDSYWGSYGDVWVYYNTKFAGMNLSDSGRFIIKKKTTMSLEVPHGAELKLCHRNKFYLPLEILTPTDVKKGTSTDVYSFEVPDYTTLHYELKLDGYIKYSHTFKTDDYSKGKLTVSEDVLKTEEEYNTKDIEKPYYANILGNVGNNRYVEMDKGEYFDLYLHRDWQAINSGTGNYYVDPIYHYEVIAGDSVTVDGEYYAGARVNAVKNGVSVVRVTYDAMEFDDTFYSRLWDERTLFIVFNVGGSSEGLKTGITHTEGDTVYYTESVNDNAVENAKGSYTFTPSTTNGEAITVETHAPLGRDGAWTEEWTTWEPDEKGAYTIDLTDGSTIVKVSAGDNVAYHVIRAHGINVNIYNATTDNKTTEINVGDNVEVSFDGLMMPVAKLAAVYNPGFPSETYAVYKLNGEDVESDHSQYSISTQNTIRFRAEEVGDYCLTDGAIHTTSIGEGGSAHWRMTRGGMVTAYMGGGGDSGESINGLFGSLPDITIHVTESEDNALKEALDRCRIIVDTYGAFNNKTSNPGISVGSVDVVNRQTPNTDMPRNNVKQLNSSLETNSRIAVTAWPTAAEDCNLLLRYWTNGDPEPKVITFAPGKAAKSEKIIENPYDSVYAELIVVPKEGVNAFANSYAFLTTVQNTYSSNASTGISNYYINDVTPYMKSLVMKLASEDREKCSPIQGLLKADPVTYTDEKGKEQTLDFGYGFIGTEYSYTSTLPNGVESFSLEGDIFVPNRLNGTETTLYVNGEAQPSLDTPISVEPGETVKLEIKCSTVAPEAKEGVKGTTGVVRNDNGPAERTYTISVHRLSAAEETAALIDKIGAASLDTEWKITRARNAYDALSAEEQDKVSNADVLFAAEETVVDIKAVAPVEELIDEIGEVTKNSADAISAAREAFDALGADRQKMVSNAAKLVEAEKAYADLTEIKSYFDDVAKGDWYFADVAYAVEHNLFKGIDENTFGPREVMTRAMFVTVLGRNAGIADSSKINVATTEFTDVDSAEYYASHVAWAVEKGITNGMGDSKFAPFREISRQDMATMMLRYAEAMGITMPAADTDAFIDDADIASYAREAVYILKSAGILTGRENNNFDPQGSATRAEVAAVLHRFLIYDFEAYQKTDDTGCVVIDIEKFTIGRGFVLEPTLVKWEEGDTVETILRRVAEEKGIELGAQSSGESFYFASLRDNDNGKINVPQYLKDIIEKDGAAIGSRATEGWLGEFDYTPASGWMIWLNHYEIQVSAGATEVKPGDVIRWQFTLYGTGLDLGSTAGFGTPYITAADKDALVHAMAVASRNQKAGDAYANAKAVMQKMDATQAEVDAAVAALK